MNPRLVGGPARGRGRLLPWTCPTSCPTGTGRTRGTCRGGGRGHPLGRAGQRVHAAADAGRARRARLVGVDGTLATAVRPRRGSPRGRAARLGPARLPAARAAAARRG